MAVKKADVLTTFEGECPACEGSGNWMKRPGYPCRMCAATGKVKVAVVKAVSGAFFRVVTAKGTVTKEKYFARARLTKPFARYRCGYTIGGGYCEHSHTDEPGSECHVYGWVPARDGSGEMVYMVMLPGGGYSTAETQAHGGFECTNVEHVSHPHEVAVEVVESGVPAPFMPVAS